MRITLYRGQTAQNDRVERLWLPSANTLRLLALGAVVALAAWLRFSNVGSLGYANHYYTAAIRSMLQSWHNFFFVAAEPGGAVSIDKPPLGLWVQAASAYLFGMSGLSVLLPEIIAGLLSVLVVYRLVRRSFGMLAGVLAALVLAITPVVVATDRNNTIDSQLILTLLLAAWAFIKATESGRLRYLLLGAALVGLGFNIKMLQAYLPLPAFFALYLLGAKEPLWRKGINLAMAAVVLLAVSLSWAVAVDLTPADQRPYVGSSGNNSVLNLALGYNGLQRLNGFGPGPGGGGGPGRGGPGPGDGGVSGGTNTSASSSRPGLRADLPNGANGAYASSAGGQGGPPPQIASVAGSSSQPGPQAGGPPPGGGGGFGGGQIGPTRLFTTPLSKEIGWVLPFGLFSAALLMFRARPSWPLAPKHQASILWGGWLITCVAFFSVAHFFHEYYLSMLGAPLAALVGIGTSELWDMRERHPWLAAGLLLAAGGATLGLQFDTATAYVGLAWWLAPIIGLFVVGVGLLVVSAISQHRYAAMAGFACVVAALLITPGVWSQLTSLYASGNQSLPSAYSGSGRQFGGGGPPQRPNNSRPAATPTAESAYEQAAVPPTPTTASASEQASGLVSREGLQLNEEMLSYLEANTEEGSYLMAVPSSMQGADYVIATGRPVLYLGGFNGMDQVISGDGIARLVASGELRFVYWGGGGGPGGGRADVSSWVSANCTPVGFEAGTSNFGAPDGTATARQSIYRPSSSNRGGGTQSMQVSLYDCAGAAGKQVEQSEN